MRKYKARGFISLKRALQCALESANDYPFLKQTIRKERTKKNTKRKIMHARVVVIHEADKGGAINSSRASSNKIVHENKCALCLVGVKMCL
jgi:hypothetical protein